MSGWVDTDAARRRQRTNLRRLLWRDILALTDLYERLGGRHCPVIDTAIQEAIAALIQARNTLTIPFTFGIETTDESAARLTGERP